MSSTPKPVSYRRRPRQAQAELDRKIVETALSHSTVYEGSALFLVQGIVVAKELGIGSGQLYRGANFVHKVQEQTGLSFLYEGVVLGSEDGSINPVVIEKESVGSAEALGPADEIERLARNLTRDELGKTIGLLAGQLASKET